MDQLEIDELAALLQTGENPERAAVLSQQYADWQKNLAKQAAQALIPAVKACATIQEVQDLVTAEIVGKSDKFREHLQALASARVTELMFARP